MPQRPRARNEVMHPLCRARRQLGILVPVQHRAHDAVIQRMRQHVDGRAIFDQAFDQPVLSLAIDVDDAGMTELTVA